MSLTKVQTTLISGPTLVISENTSASVLGFTELSFMGGGSITVESGFTFTIDVPFEAPLKRVFFGEGAIQGLKTAYPEWWGAVSDGETDCADAIQAAMRSGLSGGNAAIVRISNGTYMISKSLIIDVLGLNIVGENQAYSLIAAGAGDLNPGGPNSIFVNKIQPTNIRFERIRFAATVPYSGWGIYGSNGVSGTNSFTSIYIDNCWIDMGTLSSGFFAGGFVDGYFVGNQFEAGKTCFNIIYTSLNGQFLNNGVSNNSYGSFIDTSNVIGGRVTDFNVCNLVNYASNLGYLFDLKDSDNFNLSNIQVHFISEVPSYIPGILNALNCTGINIDNFQAVDAVGNKNFAGILISGSSVNISNGYIPATSKYNTSTIYIIGQSQVKISNVRVFGGYWGHLRVKDNAKVRVINSRFDTTNSSNVFVSDSAEVIIHSSDLLNASYASSAVTSIVTESSGLVDISNCAIGADNGGASAPPYLFLATGSGVFALDNNTYVGSASVFAPGTTQTPRATKIWT